MIKHLTESDIEQLADGALNAACRYIQNAIGQADGGPAGLFFSGDEGETIRQAFISYINYEQLSVDNVPVATREPDNLDLFISEVKSELSALKNIGMPIPGKAFELASNRISMAEYVAMPCGECADLLRELATIDANAHRATTMLVEHHTGGRVALYSGLPYAPNAHILITGGSAEVGLPHDPENGLLMIGAYNEANPEGTAITVQGRKGLNDWYEAHVGYRPDEDAGSSLPIMDLMAQVAEMLYLHTYGDGSA